jgi:two-component system response regulator FixJ
MTTAAEMIFVVDDDPLARESILALLAARRRPSRGFASAEQFLAHYFDEPGCLVCDLRLENMSGLDLLSTLRERDAALPVVMVSGVARTRHVVEAMQLGAVTMLDKPYDEDQLWAAIREALALGPELRDRRAQRRRRAELLARLTPREQETLDLIVAGLANKNIATRLNLSERGVEHRRREIFTKLECDSLADLVRLVVEQA